MWVIEFWGTVVNAWLHLPEEEFETEEEARTKLAINIFNAEASSEERITYKEKES
jgi:hypothetical protein